MNLSLVWVGGVVYHSKHPEYGAGVVEKITTEHYVNKKIHIRWADGTTTVEQAPHLRKTKHGTASGEVGRTRQLFYKDREDGN